MKLRPLRLLFDLETTALPAADRVHVLAIKDLDSGQIYRFRQNKHENTILDGIAMLNRATYITGHNIVGFDLRVLWKIYGDAFHPTATIRDTLIMSRMVFADIREKDFRLIRRKTLEGRLLGRHGLEAWGQRLGMPKDDYSARMKEKAREAGLTSPQDIQDYVWASWNEDMEDYCVQDLETNYLLWMKIERMPWSTEATIMEHQICELMERVKENGFPFDIDGARQMEEELRTVFDETKLKAIAHFGKWWVPKKWNRTDKVNRTGTTYRPNPEFGEDASRQNWGEVVVPKRSMKWKPELTIQKGGDKIEGCAYCPVKIIEFNPGSRQQIINRLETIYDWEPQEFTEKGQAVVNDEVLRELSKANEVGRPVIPIAEDLAELFYYKKRLGQLVDGKNGWIGKALETGKIHPTINPGGTITNRASHSDPNIAQVPRVVVKKIDGVKTVLKGRAGDHGWDCRNLFYVPEGWVLMGADQSGIELRALGHVLAAFDGGEYANMVIHGDVHARHQEAMDLDSRDTAKTFLYAMLYGAGDYKLGITGNPALANYPQKAKELGASLRNKLMTKIPAFGAAVKSVQREAKRGMVTALDGRELFVRSKHAAFNTKLQGIGATIAKLWVIKFEQLMEERGYHHGWNGEFAILAWVHDEIQVAVRDDPQIRADAEDCARKAAFFAGEHFNFTTPVDISVAFGENWAQTH